MSRMTGSKFDEYRNAKSRFLGIAQSQAAVNKSNAKLKPFIKDGKLDLVGAVEAGFTNPTDYLGWQVGDGDIDMARKAILVNQAIKRIEPYKKEDGKYDLFNLIKKGGSPDDIKTVFGLTDAEYQSYVIALKYIDDDSVDIEAILKDLNGGWEKPDDGVSDDGSSGRYRGEKPHSHLPDDGCDKQTGL